jgi:hypothetical protein
MGGQRVFTYSPGEPFRYWVPIAASFLLGMAIFFLDAPLGDRILVMTFCLLFTLHGLNLERARRSLPEKIIAGDGGIGAVWKHRNATTIPWGEITKVVVERQPFRDDLKKVIINGQPRSEEIVFTHRIRNYKELFRVIEQNATRAEFEEVYLWRRKKITDLA